MNKIKALPILSLLICLLAAARGPVCSHPALVKTALFLTGGLRETEASEPPPAPVIEPPAAEAAPAPENGEVKFERAAAKVKAEDIEVSNLAEAAFSSSELLSLPDEQRGGKVLILHTHGCESYAPSKKYSYKPDADIRTTDRDFNVVRVGDEIAKALAEKGIEVIHDDTLCDDPSYNNSYNNSLALAKKYLKENPDIKVILDVHRDSIEGENGKSVKTLYKDGISQLMFVVGTDKSGLSHPLWRQNLAFALKLQQQIQSKYPSLCRPVNLRKNRFNQQLCAGSLIVEVGSDANTLDEALAAARIFGTELGEYLAGE